MANDRNVTHWHPDYTRRERAWGKIRDALEGEDCVKDMGVRYLPKPSAMTTDQYKAYKERASFYAISERTLRGLSGMVFRNEPSLEIPDKMEAMKDLLTTAGYSFEVLVQELVDEVLSVGRYGILVDYPKDAKVGDLPVFATYRAEDIVNWKQEIINSKHVLTRLVLREAADNTVAGDEIEYLELELIEGVYTVTRCKVVAGKERSKDRVVVKEPPHQPTINGKTLDAIPFVFFNPYDLKPNVEKPPFLDLVNMNMGHYRNSADYEHALYLTAQPTPWIAGQLDDTKKPKAIGSGTIWFLPKESTVGFLEFQGAGIEAQRLAMQDKEDRMAALGARLIKDVADKQETAETARLRGRSEMSLLTSVVNMVQAGLQRCFKTAAEWMGANPEDVEVKVNKDFVETRMDSAELAGLVKAWQSGAISRETLHENLQKGEIIPGSRTVDEEKELIEAEGDQFGGMGVGAIGLGMGNLPPQLLPGQPQPAGGAGGQQGGAPQGGGRGAQGGASGKGKAAKGGGTPKGGK